MRAASITLLSLALTTAVVGNAFYHKKQFYPSVVYITKSNPSMAVSQAVTYYMSPQFCQKILKNFSCLQYSSVRHVKLRFLLLCTTSDGNQSVSVISNYS